MKRAAPRSLALAFPLSASELVRLELLTPGLAHAAKPDALEYALAYVERYRGDVLQLEQEWALLSAALTQAWRQEAYAAVARLVAGMAHPAGRLANLAEAEYILRLGIQACLRTRDQARLAAFSNRLSGLLFARGSYEEGWQLWNSSLALAEAAVPKLPAFWEPLISFAYIADAYLTDRLGIHAPAPHFARIIQAACESDDPDSLAVALFVRGFHARLVNDLDNAYADLSVCLRGLALQASGAPLTPARQLLMLVAQAELARAQGDYARQHAHTETALALAEVFSDRYTVAALLIDQGVFACRQGQYADLRATCLRLCELARQMEGPRAWHYSRFFAQKLAESAPAAYHLPAASLMQLQPAPAERCEPISEREREVLRLVAAGLSNQEIAGRLVITPGTVKKHLEHIYIKLAVHSRTAALARARHLSLLA